MKSFTGQVFSFGAAQALIRLRGLVTLPILSRLIGAEGYGLLAPVLALAGMLSALLLLGSNTALNVFIPGSASESRRRDFWGVAQVTLVTGLVVVVLLLVFQADVRRALLAPNTAGLLYALALVLIPVTSLQMVAYAQIVNNQLGHIHARIIAVTSLLELLLLTGGAYWFGVTGVLAATVSVQGVLCVWLLQVVRRAEPVALLRVSSLPHLKKYYTYGLTMFVAGFAAWVVDSSDRFIIARYRGADDLGVYQVAYSLCGQLNQLAAPLFATLMPFVTQAVSSGADAQAQRYLAQTCKVLLLVFAPAVLLFALNGTDLLAVLTTPGFVRGATVVPFVAAGTAIYQMAGVYTYNLHAHKRGSVLVVCAGAAALSNLGLNFLFVPEYGIIAAAASTLVAYVLFCGLCWWFARRHLKVGVGAAFVGKLVVASLGLVCATLVAQAAAAGNVAIVRLLAAGAAGGATFLVLAYVLRVFTRDEESRLWSAARQSLLPSWGR